MRVRVCVCVCVCVCAHRGGFREAIKIAPSDDSDQTVCPHLPYVPFYLKYLDRHALANSVNPESSIFDIYPEIFTHII